MQGLTRRQEQTLDFIRLSIESNGYPPTLREIGQHMGIRSTNGVNDHLVALERKGYVRREDMKSRALHLLVDSEDRRPRNEPSEDTVDVKIVGGVHASLPILAEENVVDTIRVDRMMVGGGREVFGLRMRGESMAEAGMFAGDYVFIRRQATAERGDIVLALLGDEATVRYYYPERNYVRFEPGNSKMSPVLIRNADFKSTMILGKAIGVWRRL